MREGNDTEFQIVHATFALNFIKIHDQLQHEKILDLFKHLKLLKESNVLYIINAQPMF